MSDIKLFKLGQNSVTELFSKAAKLEKDLQQLLEQQMDTFLGISFLASEFTTSNGGRIDSLGLDENRCPVIIEYKRHTNENVINQGLFYYDWLLDHKAEFQLLVMKVIGIEAAEEIEWDGARLVCIASDFNKYDEHAIKQIDKNIELMRYKFFGEDLLMLELVNTQSTKAHQPKASTKVSNAKLSAQDKNHQLALNSSSDNLLKIYNEICDFCESLGDDSQRKELKHYTAYKRIKNFASFHVLPHKKDERILMYLKVNLSAITLEDGFTHNVTNKGHWGTGNLEVVIRNQQDIEKAKPLIQQSFENN
ncbi:MAG: DUF5655 domain-containing protein [Paraglaciecola sp.]|uniref:DUF5655 domain-containing protein n=1 Tax=Paraglaciecola sp. TaxID=1920173 RepID=UPI00273D9A33|nr:DUF5655 domain-containing protein [Paraglaciecola sp.]MDP5028904.1 DUF5655 domain-containing protein [Paraglaciecola sp.]MDP5130604.1 DUF5655 domain-containing protein [Paraglaciecola sp.]